MLMHMCRVALNRKFVVTSTCVLLLCGDYTYGNRECKVDFVNIESTANIRVHLWDGRGREGRVLVNQNLLQLKIFDVFLNFYV